MTIKSQANASGVVRRPFDWMPIGMAPKTGTTTFPTMALEDVRRV